MTVEQRFVSRNARSARLLANAAQKTLTALLVDGRRTSATFALLATSLFLAAVPALAQIVELAASNAAPMEGPGAGSDTVLVYASGLQANATTTVTVTTGEDWITLATSALNITNGPNRLRFQFAANTAITRTGLIVLVPLNGSPGITITVTQAGAGFAPAGPVSVITSITGPQGIDVDSQGNLYILDVSGSNLFEWTSSTQQVSSLATGRPNNSFVDVALDAAGDIFALENTLDNLLGSQVEQIRATQGQTLPTNNIVFSSDANNFLFPIGLCVDSAGQNLNVTTVDISYKCVIDQFGSVYELDSRDANENVGSFAAPPTNASYQNPPVGQTFFPNGTYVDPCGNQLSGVSGSLYGLAKDGSGFIYFVDQNGLRVNRYDPAAPWYTCSPPPGTFLPNLNLNFGTFTTVANLLFPAFNIAADTVGNIYLSEQAFSQIQEIPRAYVSPSSPFNEPVGGGTDTIYVLPQTQTLTGVFAPVSSDTTWLNVTSAANGVVTFSFSPNPGPTRTATVNVLGVAIQVVQAESQTPAAMSIVSGNNQMTGVGGLPFAANLLVKVINQVGDAVANVPVLFASPSQQVSINTDQRGYAAATTFNASAVGPVNVTASIPGTAISQTFVLTGVQSGISVVSGSNQQAEVGFGLFGNMSVLVIGANGQPLPGVPVTFTAPASGASGTFQYIVFSPGNPTPTITVNTNANGIAQTSPDYLFSANSGAGSYTVTASISGIAGVSSSACVFNLTNFGPYEELVGNQSAYVNNAYASPLSLKVLDGGGNPIANAFVNFSVGTSQYTQPGAIFPDGSQSTLVSTGADGIATAPPMTADSLVGSFSASALIYYPNGGGTLTAGWTLTNLPSAILEGAVQNGLTSRTLTQPMIVQASAHATAGTMVFTVVPGAGGASGSFNGQNSVTVNLDPQGYGTSPLLTANSSPGTFTVTANDGVTTVQSTITTTPCLNPNSSSVVVTSGQDYNPQNLQDANPNTLRYALANACAGSNIDLTPLSGDITLTSRLRIDDNMTITGPGPGNLAIDGAHNTRLFFIGNGSVAISGLTLQNGVAQGGGSVFGGGGAGMGGAIFMEGGELTLSNMTFTGNEAVGGGSGTATLCTTNCDYGGGGFAGDAVSPEQGGSSGDLFGVAGPSNGASGGIGGGGAGTGVLQSSTALNGGNGGFAAGGGTARYTLGTLTQSGNGGFGGGGAGGADGSIPKGVSAVLPGSGGYGAGNGYETLTCAIPTPTCPAGYPYIGEGGSGAGFGGAIFEYTGQLTLNGVQFLNNSAVGGTLAGLSGQSAGFGQGKGGALFIYNGAILINNSSTFGASGLGQANFADAAGLPGNGNSAAPYTNGATCPGQDTVDICGIFGSPSPVTITVPSGLQFFINGVSYSGPQTLNLPQGQYTLAAPAPQSTGVGSQIALASWSDGGAPSHTITVGPGGLSITGTIATQYLLTVSAGPGGLAVPASSGYYTAGAVVNLNAVPNVGSVFTTWTGTVATAGSAATTVTMNAPQTVMANFTASQQVSVSVPPGVPFTLNGTNYAGPQFVPLAPGQYTLSTTSLQVSATGDQELVFNSWSDGGAISHTITVGTTPLSIGGSFTTEYQLTATAGSGGTILPVNGFYSSGTAVNLTATPNPGYVFHNWTGAVAVPSSATTTVTLSQAQMVTANFWPAPSACVAAPANVTAWWKGDGSANDETLSFNATLGGDVSFASGLVGQAFSFDGTQSPFVSVPAGAFPPQPGSGAFSFETWFQTSGANGGVILGQQPSAPDAASPAQYSPAIYVGTDGNLYVEVFYNGSTNPLVGPAPVNDNQWHHVAATYDGSTEIVYLDGANIGQSLSYMQVPNGSPLSYQLGTGFTQGWPATNNSWYIFNGLIDEPTVYSRALTAAEVLGIAQAGSYGKCDPVVSLSPVTLNFVNTAPAQTATQTAVLSNPGNAPLAISAIAADAGDTNFNLLSGNAQDCAVGTQVQPNSSCNVRVQFSPQGAGAISGQVSITDNSVVGQGTQVISLAGSSETLQPTVTFTGPSSAVYGSTFTLVASSNSGVAATILASGPCQINGISITMTSATGLCQLQATWPANAPFAAANATLSVDATPSVVTAAVTVANKTFDGTTDGTVGSCTLSNVLPADAGNVTCTAASATFASPGVDNNVPVTVSGITLGGSAAGNYQLSTTTASTTANITFGSVNSACVAPPSGVTAWWKADGDATDVTGAFGATLGGDVSFAPGQVGQAFSFDGSQSPYVLLPAGAFPAEPTNGPFTFETWFQTSGGNGGVILGEQSGGPYETNVPGWTPAIYVGSDGKLYAEVFYSSAGIAQVVSPIPVNDDAWHHVAVTYDGTNEVTYLDGGPIGTINQLVQAPNGPSLGYELGTGFTYGWANGNSGWYTFNGLIDEATVYSRALKAGEVAGIVQAGTYGKCNPVALVNPGTLTFSNTPPGQIAMLTAVLSNPGNAPLTIASIASDAGDANFSVLSGNAGDCAAGTPVQSNATCNIRVQFSPQSAGSLNGSVTVQENALYSGGVQTIQLSGTALEPQSISFGSIATQTVGTPLTLSATATSGLVVSFNSATPSVCTVTGNTATFLTYGSCTVTAVQSGNGTYSAANPVSQTFVVMSPQTITFPGIGSQMLGTQLTLAATASSGLPVGYSSSTTKVCSISGNTVAFVATGTCTINATQAGNASYLPAAPVTQSFSVAEEAQSITWATIPTEAVQQTVPLTASASSGLPVAYTSSPTSVCTVSGSTATMIGGGTCTIKATQAGNSTYAPQSASQSFTVTKLAQSITFAAVATPQSIGAQATLSAISTSGLTVALAASPATVCTISGTTVSFVAAGNCKLTATQPGNGMYSAATAVSQSIVVDKIAQTISFGSIANQIAGSNLALAATASSGLAVTYSASPSSVCTVSNSSASFVGAGTCTVTAAQSGNATYSAAPSVSQSFMVSKQSQSISFPSISAQNVGATVTLAASATSGLTVSYSATPSSVCTVSGSTATMAGSGTCTITASQSGNNIYASATAVPQSFLVSKLMQTITFGSIGSQTVGASLTLTATASSGLAVSYSATPSNVCKVSGSTVTMTGSGTCTITASQAGNSTYAAATSVPVSFEVIKVAQTITFGAIPTQTVGTPLTLTASASSGLAVTYTASPSKVCKVSGSTATMSAAGTCNITAAQSGNAEYAAAPSVLESFQVVQ